MEVGGTRAMVEVTGAGFRPTGAGSLSSGVLAPRRPERQMRALERRDQTNWYWHPKRSAARTGGDYRA